MSQISEMVRTDFKKGDDIRDAGLITPEDIVRYNDITYGWDPQWQSLDVYRPKEAMGQKLPVIVSVHGGGWVYGDKERYQYYCMNLAQRGFAVVNFTYRLAPENKFPAQLEDTNMAFKWVLRHAQQYCLDSEHIFAVGDSAGAHILALYNCICTNPEYAAEYSFKPPEDFAPTAVAFNCGVFSVSLEPGPDGDLDLIQQLTADYLPDKGSVKELKLINVTIHVTPKFPPTFLMTSNGDFLKGQAPILEATLTEKEIPHISRFYGNKNLTLGHVFHCNIKTADAALCNDEECAFFREFI